MKWIGQQIYDLASRFRNDVFLEDISSGTIASGAHLGLDSNNKIVKAVDGGGDVTLAGIQTFTGSKTMGTDVKLSFRDANSFISSPTANDLEIVATDIVLDAATLVKIETSDLTMYDPVNDGNPTISLGSSDTNKFEIKAGYNSGAQTLDIVSFNTFTTSTTTNDGRYSWLVDEVELARLIDTGLIIYGGLNCQGAGAKITSLNTTASSTTQGGTFSLRCDDGAAMGDDHRLGVVQFEGAEDSSSNRQIGARIQAMCDAAWSASENGTRLEFYTMDGNASSELSLTLDSNLLATFSGGVTVTGTITGDVTGDLTGTAQTVSTIAGLAPNTATTQATQGNITTCSSLVSIGTITTGEWNATEIASAKMAAGTASAKGALELATTGEADTGTDTARAVTPAGLKSHVDAYARKCILRHQAFYVNDNPMVQNSLYFGSSIGHQLGNWNDPQAAGGVIGDTASFTINKVDENWGMLLPFDISKVEVQCSLQPQLGTGDDFTVAIYTGIRPNDSAAVLTLTKVAHQSIAFSSGSNRTMINDVSLTADLAKNTMIYVGLGSEDNTDAKNGRGYLTVTVTER